MKKAMTKTLKTRIIAAAMAFVAMAGTTAVMMESSVNDTSICASDESNDDFLLSFNNDFQKSLDYEKILMQNLGIRI